MMKFLRYFVPAVQTSPAWAPDAMTYLIMKELYEAAFDMHRKPDNDEDLEEMAYRLLEATAKAEKYFTE